MTDVEISELKKDKERLDWLSKIDLVGIDHMGYGEYRHYAGGSSHKTIRQVIDIAMLGGRAGWLPSSHLPSWLSGELLKTAPDG